MDPALRPYLGVTWPLTEEELPKAIAKCYRYRNVRDFPFTFDDYQYVSSDSQIFVCRGSNWVYTLEKYTVSGITTPNASTRVRSINFEGDMETFKTDIVGLFGFL